MDFAVRLWVEPSLSNVGALLGSTGLATGRIAANVGERLDVLALRIAKCAVCASFLAVGPLLLAFGTRTDGQVRS